MVRFGMGVGGGADGLETGFREWGLVGRKRAHTSGAAGRKQRHAASRESDDDGKPKKFQGKAKVINRLFTGCAIRNFRRQMKTEGFLRCQLLRLRRLRFGLRREA